MITLDVFNRQGDKVGTVDVDEADFGGKINRQLLHDVVLMYLANQRAGTHSTLRRGEVSGSTKKLFRQKGTGNARVGPRRTNKRKGGGTAKGPKPRDYSYSMPKKAVRASLRMALLSKFQDNEVVVLDELKLEQIKTRDFAAVLRALKIEGLTCLVGTTDYDMTLFKSARNIPGVEVKPTSQFNTYGVLRPKRLLLTRASLEALKKPAAAKKEEAVAAR
jgi:large subunit ribosomal protein L4